MSESQILSTSDRIKQKQEQLLLELSATVNTLASLDEVLEDIVALTSPDDHDKKPNSIARKQEILMKELNNWKDLTELPSSGRLQFANNKQTKETIVSLPRSSTSNHRSSQL